MTFLATALAGDDEMRDLPCSYGSGSREAFMETIRKRIDRPMWLHLLSHMGLETLMDAKAREQFRAGLEKNPPEATAENCFATMHALVEDADLIFRRGLVEAFCRLDRRFRSHDGFKLGARIILPYMFCEYTGTLNSDRAATLRDVERVFYVLDS